MNELLLREIAGFVLERQPVGMGFVTFLGVDTTDDLMEAKVFYSVMGSEEEKEKTLEILVSLKPEMVRSMRRLESLKRIPDFRFIYDDTPARAARVSELLGEIRKEDTPPSDKSEK